MTLDGILQASVATQLRCDIQ